MSGYYKLLNLFYQFMSFLFHACNRLWCVINEYLNLFNLFVSFLLYVRKRLLCVINEYLSKPSGLPNSESYDEPSSEIPRWDTALLTNKRFSYKSTIFHPIIPEVRLFCGFVGGLQTLRSRRSIKMDQQCAIFKTASSMDMIMVKYEGSLRFMTRNLDFEAVAVLKNMKIFTKFNICPYSCESTLDNLYIDDIRLALNFLNFSLHNYASNFVLSAILKIVSFFILCLFEFVIGNHLKLRFRKNDLFQIDPEQHDLKTSVCNYMENTEIVNKFVPTKYFTTALSDVLIEDNRNMLVQKYPQFFDVSLKSIDFTDDSSDSTLVDESKKNNEAIESGDSAYEDTGNNGLPTDSTNTLVNESKQEKDSGHEGNDSESDRSEAGLVKGDRSEAGLVKGDRSEAGAFKSDSKSEADSDESDNKSDAGSDESDNKSDAGSDESEVTTDVPDTESESGTLNYYFCLDPQSDL